RRRLLLYRRDEVLVGRAAPPRLQILTIVQGHARARALGFADLLHDRTGAGAIVDAEGEHLDVLPHLSAGQRQLALGVLAQRRALDRQLAHDAGALARRVAVVPPEADPLPRRQHADEQEDDDADLHVAPDLHALTLALERPTRSSVRCHRP